MSRGYPRGTKLAFWIERTGKAKYRFCADVGIHPRTMTEYLAQREPISHAHLLAICDYLNVEPEDVTGTVDDWEPPKDQYPWRKRKASR